MIAAIYARKSTDQADAGDDQAPGGGSHFSSCPVAGVLRARVIACLLRGGRPALVIAGVLLGGCASGPERVPARLLADRAQVQGCELLTLVRDSDVDDLREKAAKKGGNVVLVAGQAGSDVSFIITSSRIKYVGEVYRCP